MMNKPVAKISFIVAILVLTLTVSQILAAPDEGTVKTSYSPSAPLWEFPPGELISLAGDSPVMAYSPNGGQLIIAYNHWVTNEDDRDPYYSLSNNHGQSWTGVARIHTDPGANAGFVDLAFDVNNQAHSIWVDRDDPVNILFHARQNQWASNFANTVRLFIGLIQDPVLATGPAAELHVVWAEGDALENPDLYHAYSTNGGTDWTPTGTIKVTTPTSLRPDLEVDQNGDLHLVWEEGTATSDNQILYSKGTLVGSDVNWTNPVSISSVVDDAREPNIQLHNGTLHVSYTSYESAQIESIYYAVCSASCTNSGNWGSINASVATYGVNPPKPSRLISQVRIIEGSPAIYFHGTDIGISYNEVLWGVYQKDGWGGVARDQVTLLSSRAINPYLALDGEWMHIAFEKVVGDSRQIYVMSGRFPVNEVFLPSVIR